MRLKVLIEFVDLTNNKKRPAGDVFEAEQARGEQLLADARGLVELAEPAEEKAPEPEEKEASLYMRYSESASPYEVEKTIFPLSVRHIP